MLGRTTFGHDMHLERKKKRSTPAHATHPEDAPRVAHHPALARPAPDLGWHLAKKNLMARLFGDEIEPLATNR